MVGLASLQVPVIRGLEGPGARRALGGLGKLLPVAPVLPSPTPKEAAFSISKEQTSCSAIHSILCSPNCDILGLFGRRWGWAGVERTPECSHTDIWCLDFAGSRDSTINPLTLIAFLSASISGGNKMPLQLMENEPPMRRFASLHKSSWHLFFSPMSWSYPKPLWPLHALENKAPGEDPCASKDRRTPS